MVVSEDFIKKVYSGGDIPLKGPLLTPLPPRPYNLMKPITSLSNINSKIKKMRCNVCQSQSSIDKVMGRNQKVCDMCETVPVDPFKTESRKNRVTRMLKGAPAANNTIKRLKKFKPLKLEEIAKKTGLPLKLSPNNLRLAKEAANSRRLNAAAEAATRKANALKNNNSMKQTKRSLLKGRKEFGPIFPRNNASAAAEAAKNAKLNASLQNNGFSIDAAGQGAKAENNAEAARAAMKERLIQVKNEEGKNVWIDPKNNSVYLNSNATISTKNSLGGVNNTNSTNPNNKGKLWYKKNGNTESKYLNMTKENYNAKKTNTKATRKNRRSTRRSTRTARR